MPMNCVSVDASLIQSCKITTSITNIFGIGVMILLTLYLQLKKDKCV